VPGFTFYEKPTCTTCKKTAKPERVLELLD
jgi:hypothetical protein